MLYLFALAILIGVYVFIIIMMKRFKNAKIVNIVFIATAFICYVALSVKVCIDVGFDDWNFQNTLPTANVSPFMFATLPLSLILPKKARKAWFLLISLLSVGMLFAVVLGCVYRAVINYKFHLSFMLDHVSHLALSLFGIYLVKSGQVELKVKNCLKSGSLIVSVAATMMILNVALGTSFFGLSFNGGHNIYNMRLVDNGYLSALLYFVGLVAVLITGYFYVKALSAKKRTDKDLSEKERL